MGCDSWKSNTLITALRTSSTHMAIQVAHWSKDLCAQRGSAKQWVEGESDPRVLQLSAWLIHPPTWDQRPRTTTCCHLQSTRWRKRHPGHQAFPVSVSPFLPCLLFPLVNLNKPLFIIWIVRETSFQLLWWRTRSKHDKVFDVSFVFWIQSLNSWFMIKAILCPHLDSFSTILTFSFIVVQLLDDSLAELSLGKLCEADGFPYERREKEPLSLLKDGKRVEFRSENHVPSVLPGVLLHTERDQTNALGDRSREKALWDWMRDLLEWLQFFKVGMSDDTSKKLHELLWK